MYVNDFEFDGKLLSSFGFSCMTWNGDPNASSNVPTSSLLLPGYQSFQMGAL